MRPVGDVFAVMSAGEKPSVKVGQPLSVSFLEAFEWAANVTVSRSGRCNCVLFLPLLLRPR